jgi:hypothetical protein
MWFYVELGDGLLHQLLCVHCVEGKLWSSNSKFTELKVGFGAEVLQLDSAVLAVFTRPEGRDAESGKLWMGMKESD